MSSRFALLVLPCVLALPAAAQEFSASPPPLAASQFAPHTRAPAPLQSPDLRASLPYIVPPTPELVAPPDSFGQTPAELYPWIESVARARPREVKLRIIGESASGASLVALEITPPGKSPWNLKRLVVMCRQHGNEPESTASGARMIYHWLGPRTARERALVARTALLIVPIANPDGAALYQRRTALNIDMNRDWGQNKSVEVRALTQWIRGWKPHLVVDNHQWLPSERMPVPMAEASGGAKAQRAARIMAQRNAQSGHALSARSRWGLDTLAHRFWGQKYKTPAVLLETRHLPGNAGARSKAIEQAEVALWGAAESVN